MTDIFISYARSTEAEAKRIAEALRSLGYGVWRDDELPAHRAYAEVIEERLQAAKAVVVVWSAEAVKSQWVFSEANRAREDGKLVQLNIDGARLPMPFDSIQCADLAAWDGVAQTPGWRKVVASVAELIGGARAPPARDLAPDPPLALPSRPSIAVMPFANLSGDPEQDYFADGMVEEIVAALTRNRAVFVIASSSTSGFRGRSVSPQEIARRLGVRYILEGSVRKAGGRVRIAVRLLDAADGAQMWADRFDDTLEDVFALQDQVALSVAGIIEPTVQAAEIRKVAKRPTESLGGYDLFLRAQPLFWAFQKETMAEALVLLERAVALDSEFGMAVAMAATCHRMMVDFQWSDDIAAHRAAGLDLATRALALAGDDARALAHVASALMGLEPSPDRAATVIERALSLNPGCAYAWLVSGLLHTRLGEPDRAVADFETAVRLDPLSAIRGVARWNTGLARFQQGRFAEALPLILEQSTAVAPVWHAVLAATCGHLGRISEARAALARLRAVSHLSAEDLGDLWFRKAEHRGLLADGIALAEADGGGAV